MSPSLPRGMLLLVGVLAAWGCAPAAASESVRVEIRHRPLELDPEALARSYREEHAYIRERRAATGRAFRRSDLTGIALSGGGIRSATYGLGVLQALDEMGVTHNLDYMSAASGGGYLAAWVQAQLGAEGSGAESFRELLANEGEYVAHLRGRSRFLLDDSFASGPKLFLRWLARYPAYLLLDVTLHVKGPYNEHSLIEIYEDRIEETYLGEPGVPLTAINAYPERTPYLVLTANLVNRGRLPLEPQGPTQRRFGFEFTRDLVGADPVGYLPTSAFDRPVHGVEQDHESGLATHAMVASGSGPGFSLARAAAISGAAVDPDGFPAALRAAVSWFPLNLNLGYHAPNFARAREGPLGGIVDYSRMISIERVPEALSTHSRWLKLTDGGHFDKTAVFALLRRGATCVIAVDAGGDFRFRYKDMKRLRELVEGTLGLEWRETRAVPDAAREIELWKGGEHRATILLLKPNASEGSGLPHLHGVDPSLLAIRKYQSDGPRGWFGLGRERFPHTPVFIQVYDRDRFEAYRLLGQRMAKTYIRPATDPSQPFSCRLSDAAQPGSRAVPNIRGRASARVLQNADQLIHHPERDPDPRHHDFLGMPADRPRTSSIHARGA